MNITKQSVKDHLKKHHVKYIVGGTVVLGTLSMVAYYKRLAKTPEFNMMDYVDKLKLIDPSIKIEELKWAEIGPKNFLTLVPEEFAVTELAEAVDHHVGPVIFGSAVAFMNGDDLIAVFGK